jgi:uncharacterized protein
MQFHRFQDFELFNSQAMEYLLKREVPHCLMLSICQNLTRNPEVYGTQPYLAIVEENGAVVAVAMQTEPYNLLLSAVANFEAIDLLIPDVHSAGKTVPGMSSFPEESKAFTDAWKAFTGQACKLGMQLRIHQLDTVQKIARSSGQLRAATTGDRELLLNWLAAFYQETFQKTGENIERVIDRKLQETGIYLWEDSEPVSMAWGRTSTENAAIVGPVYTPPEYRKKGYATACVAELSQLLLTQGFRNCLLFTDVTNPTSNRIYRNIGYQPVCDWHDYKIVDS